MCTHNMATRCIHIGAVTAGAQPGLEAARIVAPADLAPDVGAPEIWAPSGRTYRSYAATALMQVRRVADFIQTREPSGSARGGCPLPLGLRLQLWRCLPCDTSPAVQSSGWSFATSGSLRVSVQAALDAIETASRAGPDGLPPRSVAAAPDLFQSAAGVLWQSSMRLSVLVDIGPTD